MKKEELFDRIKSALHISSKDEEGCEDISDNSEDSTGEESTQKPAVQYHETLYSKDSKEFKQKQSMSHLNTRPMYLRDMAGIEKDIDSLSHIKIRSDQSGIDRKVDGVLSKKNPSANRRKTANVIYVVSKPQPGQVKGDWAVRSHRKIFSHHRTKKAAIAKARTVALEKEATVLVQNTDGTFSAGFKPRKKKK